ncbi:MAG: entericidin A/B family lipoprotein [Alphaproteobacteria bacterium]|nr:entericidin A/B family lipoprotein [Alphaproteobacteria bacterium]
MKLSNFFRFAILLGGLAIASCNTVEGVGEDAQSAGRAVSDTADDAK